MFARLNLFTMHGFIDSHYESEGRDSVGHGRIDFYATAGVTQNSENPTKLRRDDIAHAVKAALEMDDRGFVTELTVFATNPKD
jgi:3-oxoacyl-[acyl-carrier protein] reductase